MAEEVIGKFVVEDTPAKYGTQYTVKYADSGKRVGSTFDDDLGNKLLSYPEGATLALDVDRSGQYWTVTDARLANGDGAKSTRTTPRTEQTFGDDALRFFMGNSARVVAAYLRASKEYVDQVENTKNPIETLHKDIVFGAKLLLNEANRRG